MNRRQMWKDLIILIIIMVAIYYLRIQAGDVEVFNPVTSLEAFLGIGD